MSESFSDKLLEVLRENADLTDEVARLSSALEQLQEGDNPEGRVMQRPELWLGKRVRIKEADDIVGVVRSVTIYMDETYQVEVSWWSQGERKATSCYADEIDLEGGEDEGGRN